MKDLYKKNEKTIYDRINAHKKKFCSDWNELICVANMAFVEAYQNWDQSKSNFNTYLYNTLNIKLHNYVKKERKRFYREINADEFVLDRNPSPIKDKYDIIKHESKNNLSVDGKIVIQIILNNKYKIENGFNKITKNSIRNYLKSIGWSNTSINFAFKSIEQHLRSEGIIK